MNSNSQQEVSLSVDEERLVGRVRGAMRSIAEAVVGHVAHDVVAHIFMEEFVTSAHRLQLMNGNERATQSQIGWMTGLASETIREVLNRPAAKIQGPLTIEDRVLWTWQNDYYYRCRKTGAPAKLLILGRRGTFQGLVAGVVRGVTAQLALQSLLTRHRVELIDSHWVSLIRPEPRFQPSESSPYASSGRRDNPDGRLPCV